MRRARATRLPAAHAALLSIVLLVLWHGVALAADPAPAPSPPKYLAVVGLKTLGESAAANGWLGVAVGEELATRLGSDRQRVCTLERLQLNELLAAKGQSAPMLALGEESAEADSRCVSVLRAARSSRKLAGADALLLGSIICTPQALKAATRLVNIETGAVEAAILTETSYAAGDPARAVQALAVDLTAKWCVKLNVTLTPEMKATASDKSATYEAWGKAREYLYRGQYEECLERIKWAEGQVSDPNLVQGLLGTRDEAWEMQFATAQADPQRKDAFLKQMLATAGSTYAAYKRGFATAAYYYGRALERGGLMKEAEARYRECLAQRPTGVRWEVDLDSACRGIDSAEGVVYAPSASGMLVAIEAATGRVLWRFKGLADEASLAGVHGSVCVVLCGTSLCGLDRATGHQVWTVGGFKALHVWGASGGTLYCRVDAPPDYLLQAIDMDKGAVLWELRDLMSTGLVLDGGSVYVSGRVKGEQRGYVSKVQASDGTVLWATRLPSNDLDTFPWVSVSGETVYADEQSGRGEVLLSLLDAQTGALLRQGEHAAGLPYTTSVAGVTYTFDGKTIRAANRLDGALLWQRDWPCGLRGPLGPVMAAGSLGLYLAVAEGVVALDPGTGGYLWYSYSGVRGSPQPLWVYSERLYGVTGSLLLAWDLRTGTVVNSYHLQTEAGQRNSLDFEMPEEGLLCATIGTRVRAVELGACNGWDAAEYATAGLMRCLMETGQAKVAWRLAARSLWENEARSAPFMHAAMRARTSAGDDYGGRLISHADSPLFAPLAADGRLWEARTNETGEWRRLSFGLCRDSIVLKSDGGGGNDGVAARDATTGRLLWEQIPPRGGRMGMTIAGSVVCLYGPGGVYAYDAESGKLLWETAQPMVDAYRTFVDERQRIYLMPVTSPTRQPFEGHGLVALDLRTGAVVCTIKSDQALAPRWVSDGTVGCHSYQSKPGTDDLKVFSTETGDQIWSRCVHWLYFEGRPEGNIVLVPLSAPDGRGCLGVEAVEMRTGRVLWRREQPRLRRAVSAAGVCYMETETGLEVFDSADGRTLWTDRISDGAAVLAPEEGIVCTTSWDRHVDARDVRTGADRWYTGLAVKATSGKWPQYLLRQLVVYDCANDTVVALDAATGRTRWQATGRVGPGAEAGGLDGAVPVWPVDNYRQLRLLDPENGRLLANCVADTSVGQCLIQQGKAWVDIDGHLVAIDLRAMRQQKPARAIWLTRAQGYIHAIWGKGAVAVRKALDGVPLSQIMRYEPWLIEEKLAAEINRLATLGDWNAEGALAADPATLCPPFLQADAELVKENISPAAQVFLRASKTIRANDGGAKAEREYLEAAARMAPEWDAPKQALAALKDE